MAKKKFKKGDRVVATKTNPIDGKRSSTGIVTGYSRNGNCVRVLRDGLKNADNWAEKFWKLDLDFIADYDEDMYNGPTWEETEDYSYQSHGTIATGIPSVQAVPEDSIKTKLNLESDADTEKATPWVYAVKPEARLAISAQPLSVWQKLKNFVRGFK